VFRSFSTCTNSFQQLCSTTTFTSSLRHQPSPTTLTNNIHQHTSPITYTTSLHQQLSPTTFTNTLIQQRSPPPFTSKRPYNLPQQTSQRSSLLSYDSAGFFNMFSFLVGARVSKYPQHTLPKSHNGAVTSLESMEGHAEVFCEGCWCNFLVQFLGEVWS